MRLQTPKKAFLPRASPFSSMSGDISTADCRSASSSTTPGKPKWILMQSNAVKEVWGGSMVACWYSILVFGGGGTGRVVGSGVGWGNPAEDSVTWSLWDGGITGVSVPARCVRICDRSAAL
ncbi:unnamed protein product, partial [Mycena citricolor]